MSPKKRDNDARPAHNGRDFADMLAGSDRLDPETTLPLPDSAVDNSSEPTQPSAPESSPPLPNGVVEGRQADEAATAPDYSESKALPAEDMTPDEETLDKDLKTNEGLNEEVRDRAEVIGTTGRWFAGWCLRFLVMGAAAYILFNFLGQVWAGILPILLSIIVCTVLWPVVRTLRKWHIPNALAVLIALLGSFAAIGGILGAMAPSAVEQTGELINKANDGIFRIQDYLSGPPFNLESSQLNDAISQATNWLQEQAGQIATTVAAGASATMSALVTLFIVLVLTFFFLKDGEHFLPTVRRITGRRVGWHLTEVLTRMWNTLGGFIRTQALVSFIDAFFIGIGLVILDVPLAGFLAVITFFAGFIPMVGAVTAGALSVLIALVAVDFATALIVLAIIIAVQQLEGNILQPVLQSRAMNVHPVIILLAVTIGGTLFGIVGAFLAVPVAAMIMVALRYMGDLTDLATGEKTSAQIKFSTTAGALTGAQSEQAAKQWFSRLKQSQDESAAASSHHAHSEGSDSGKFKLGALLKPLRGNTKSSEDEK